MLQNRSKYGIIAMFITVLDIFLGSKTDISDKNISGEKDDI